MEPAKQSSFTWLLRRLFAFSYFVLFCGLLWYAIGAAWWKPYRYLHGYVESARTIEVTITNAQRSSARFCGANGWRYTYIYTVGKQRYTGYAASECRAEPYEVGTKIPAIYDVNSPNISYVAGDVEWSVFYMLGGCTLLILGSAAYLLLRWTPARRARDVQPEPGSDFLSQAKRT